MADTLIVYYSLEGNIDFVARKLAKELNADLHRIETVKEYPKKGLAKFLHGGKDAVSGFKPELKNELPSLSDYAKIVVGSPVWAGKPAAPINTFLEKSDFSGKTVFAFASSAGGNAEKCLKAISDTITKKGGTIYATASFTNPARNPEAALDSINAFAEKIVVRD